MVPLLMTIGKGKENPLAKNFTQTAHVGRRNINSLNKSVSKSIICRQTDKRIRRKRRSKGKLSE